MDYYFFRRNLYTIQFVFEYPGQLDIPKLAHDLDKAISIFDAIGSRIKLLSNKETVLETGHPVSVRTQVFEAEPLSIDTGEKFLDCVENLEGEPIGFHHASLSPRLGLILPSDDGVVVHFKRPNESSAATLGEE